MKRLADPVIAVAVVGLITVLLVSGNPRAITPPPLVVVVVVLALGGALLVAMIRGLEGRRAPAGRWLRRSAVCALLLTPAAILATRPFLPGGWDFDDCGSLLDPNRRTEPQLADFLAACEVAAAD